MFPRNIAKPEPGFIAVAGYAQVSAGRSSFRERSPAGRNQSISSSGRESRTWILVRSYLYVGFCGVQLVLTRTTNEGAVHRYQKFSEARTWHFGDSTLYVAFYGAELVFKTHEYQGHIAAFTHNCHGIFKLTIDVLVTTVTAEPSPFIPSMQASNHHQHHDHSHTTNKQTANGAPTKVVVTHQNQRHA